MPIYEYDCYDCGLRSEDLRSSIDLSQYTCPGCTSKNTKKTPSTASIHVPFNGYFKGSGSKDLDKVIGASSEQRWGMYKDERGKRDDIRKQSGQVSIAKSDDGKYVSAPKEYLQCREDAFTRYNKIKSNSIKVEHD